MRATALFALTATACGRVNFGAVDGAGIDQGLFVDAIDPRTPWGTPNRASALTMPGDDDPTLTGDQRELFFTRTMDLYVMTRAAATDAWGTPQLISELATAAVESNPDVSADGLTMYFTSNRDASFDTWITTRVDRSSAWQTPALVSELAADFLDEAPAISFDELAIVWASERATPGRTQIHEATRRITNEAFSGIATHPMLSSTAIDTSPYLSSDRLALYLQTNRSGNHDVWIATRSSPEGAFGAPTPVTELNTTAYYEGDPWVSPDGRTIYFVSSRMNGQMQIYVATR